METLIQDFTNQLKEAIFLGKNAKIIDHFAPIQNIVISGMGGSSIGGNLLSSILRYRSQIPLFINNTYDIPAFINEHTLFIASSYSGNTEETISALQYAALSKAKIVCICSGGKMMELAAQNQWDIIVLPSGYASPRACLGFSLVAQAFVLHHLGIIESKITDEFQCALDLLSFEQDEIKKIAYKMAVAMQDKIPVLYTNDDYLSIAIRWRQQLNENAKKMCWTNALPEMNHNEIIGWIGGIPNSILVFLRYKEDHKRIQKRIELTKNILASQSDKSIEIFAKGKNPTERLIYMVHLGDWLSLYLAELNNIEPTEIKAIDFLKNELVKPDFV